MTDITVCFLLFLLGAGAGSFIDATAGRMHQCRRLNGRSKCDKCGHKLSIAELVPIVSWLVLHGRCQKCHKKIGVRPLLAELATASFFAASYLIWPFGGIGFDISLVLFGLWLIILMGLVFLLIYDARYKKLPDEVTWPTIGISLVFWVILSVTNEQNICSNLLNLAYAMVPIAGLYALVSWVSGGKLIGLGDAKLGIIIGFLLPWWGGVGVLLLANMLAFVFILPLLVTKHAKLNDTIPFGPFLIVATIIVFFVMKFFVDFF